MPALQTDVNGRDRLNPVVAIVSAQLLGTSLWFSPNSVAPAIAADWETGASSVGYLTASVQAGFIVGTLVLSFSGLADRFAASRTFVISALCGAAFNGALVFGEGFGVPAATRFATGLTLAGIYPLGMKLIVSWVPEKAGWALGWLVGMLTLGTALPHLVRGVGVQWPYRCLSR